MDVLARFSERLKELMTDNGLNTLSLEKATGCTNSNISKWLHRKKAPTLNSLIILSDFFECSLDYLTGRSDDMLIIRGVNVFPSQIESVLLSIGQLEPHYMLYVDRKGALDILTVEVEMSQELFSDEVKNIESLEKKLHAKIESTLGISADVRLVAPKTLPRSEGKAKRVIDRRNLFNK